MGTRSRSEFWRDERLGLAMIGASLIVIGVIVGAMYLQQRAAAEVRVRGQATSLTRLLAAMPYDQLVSAGSLQALASSQPHDELAYAAIADPAGAMIREAVRPGATIPQAAPPAPDSRGITERTLSDATSDGTAPPIVEFQTPLVTNGQLAGYLRVGYFQPRNGLNTAEIPFLASLALAIFLLTPIFYFLVRNEIRPIRSTIVEIDRVLASGSFEHLNMNARGSANAFLKRFNAFADFARDRLSELEHANTRLLTSAKLLGYQKQRLERTLEAVPDVVLLLDETGTVSFVNSKVRGLFGVAAEDVVGHTPEEWCKDHKIVDFISRSEHRSVARQLTQSLEFSPSGSTDKTFSLRVFPLLSGQSTVSGKLLVFRDVTTESLAARSRGEFVAHLAHELKTPLNVLAMYSETLQDNLPGGEAQRVEAVNAISDEVQRLATLIDNLLSITRIEMGSLKLERQRVNLKDLLQDAFDHVSRSGRGHGLTFKLDVPENLVAAALDKNLLRVALNNLLTNAIKYSDSGGTVTMGAEETPDALRIYVADTGIGIKPEDRERIFDRFYRADDENTRSRPGHGLGLSLARDIVQMHHGVLRVESEVGVGSKFYIDLWKDTMMLQQAS